MPTNPFAAPFVQAVGGDLRAEVEQRQNPGRIGHVWIAMANQFCGQP
ncbi:MAG TPA: hypothetical protein VIS96_02405 [Terrimicrobiaceae bacterium]